MRFMFLAVVATLSMPAAVGAGTAKASATAPCGTLEGLAADAQGIHPSIPGSFYLKNGVRVDLFLAGGARISGLLAVRHVSGKPVVFWQDTKSGGFYRVADAGGGKAEFEAVTDLPKWGDGDSLSQGTRHGVKVVGGCPVH